MLPVYVTVVILIAHLFTFRQFVFALIDVQTIKAQIEEKKDEIIGNSFAPVGVPIVFEPSDETFSTMDSTLPSF